MGLRLDDFCVFLSLFFLVHQTAMVCGREGWVFVLCYVFCDLCYVSCVDVKKAIQILSGYIQRKDAIYVPNWRKVLSAADMNKEIAFWLLMLLMCGHTCMDIHVLFVFIVLCLHTFVFFLTFVLGSNVLTFVHDPSTLIIVLFRNIKATLILTSRSNKVHGALLLICLVLMGNEYVTMVASNQDLEHRTVIALTCNA